MNPRDLIVKGLIDSGYTEIHRRERSVLFQKPNCRAFHFRFDAEGNYTSTGHRPDGEDYLLPLEIKDRPSAFIVADLAVSTCGTAYPAHVYDKVRHTYWHVERVVGHPHRATELAWCGTVAAEDLVCAELLDAVSAYHDQCELEELEAWRDQLNED